MAERGNPPPPPDETPSASTGREPDEPQPWGAGAAAPRPRWRRRANWAAAGVAVAAIAVAAGWAVTQSFAPRAVTGIFAGGDAPPDPAMDALRARIDALETASARLDGRIAATAARARAALPQTDAARLGARIEALETRPAPRPPPPDGRIAPLVEAVDALAKRLEALERSAAASTGVAASTDVTAPSVDRGAVAGPGIAALLAENARRATALGRMTERMARLEAALATALETGNDPELARLVESAGARVDGIEAELKRLAATERSRGGDALLLALGQLREAAAGPRPFDAELRTVLKAAAGDPGIEDAARPLEALAAAGIPTPAALAARFPALAIRAAQAALASEEGDWLDRTAARLLRVVTIRRVGEGVEEGGGALAAIARAESRLAAGDLAAAAAALDGLEGAPADVFGEWRDAARARAAADAAIAGLSRRAVERFAAAGRAG